MFGGGASQDDFVILENGNLYIERLSGKYAGVYMCQASNEYGQVEAKTELRVRSVQQRRPPPLIVYGPQNQTIPINTHATLDCLAVSPTTSSMMTGNSGNSGLLQQQQQSSAKEDKISIGWLKNEQPVQTVADTEPAADLAKFRLLENGVLEIRAVQK